MSHVWIVETKTRSGWKPHENLDWFDTKKDALKTSSRDHELRTAKYARVE